MIAALKILAFPAALLSGPMIVAAFGKVLVWWFG